MKPFDIYLIGVGGQGIGLLSEIILRAADHAGFPVRGVDTHGLAQRGGTVSSHVRIGEGIHSALIRKGHADLVIALERNEALRGMNDFLKDGGTLVYYNTEWQPLSVRLKKEKPLKTETISEECERRRIKEVRIEDVKLEDPRMQNTVVLSRIAKNDIVPGVKPEDYELAMADLMGKSTFEKNIGLLRSLI